eukprot:CAMPEP_0172518706 /NCGR_PEP_ID=MMETSP1066-20121228/290977_1 /TAXON_ID=671091 /ORGANISM="Coscinodiscus wailesii, Strain CCMP2513" /LENGTH=421 /DNA_ID=CAMNT_0013301145 /DNA_START=345 /DNA_END=1610 /DNA_ORIENTATION=-
MIPTSSEIDITTEKANKDKYTQDTVSDAQVLKSTYNAERQAVSQLDNDNATTVIFLNTSSIDKPNTSSIAVATRNDDLSPNFPSKTRQDRQEADSKPKSHANIDHNKRNIPQLFNTTSHNAKNNPQIAAKNQVTDISIVTYTRDTVSDAQVLKSTYNAERQAVSQLDNDNATTVIFLNTSSIDKPNTSSIAVATRNDDLSPNFPSKTRQDRQEADSKPKSHANIDHNKRNIPQLFNTTSHNAKNNPQIAAKNQVTDISIDSKLEHRYESPKDDVPLNDNELPNTEKDKSDNTHDANTPHVCSSTVSNGVSAEIKHDHMASKYHIHTQPTQISNIHVPPTSMDSCAKTSTSMIDSSTQTLTLTSPAATQTDLTSSSFTSLQNELQATKISLNESHEKLTKLHGLASKLIKAPKNYSTTVLDF